MVYAKIHVRLSTTIMEVFAGVNNFRINIDTCV